MRSNVCSPPLFSPCDEPLDPVLTLQPVWSRHLFGVGEAQTQIVLEGTDDWASCALGNSEARPRGRAQGEQQSLLAGGMGENPKGGSPRGGVSRRHRGGSRSRELQVDHHHHPETRGRY